MGDPQLTEESVPPGGKEKTQHRKKKERVRFEIRKKKGKRRGSTGSGCNRAKR